MSINQSFRIFRLLIFMKILQQKYIFFIKKIPCIGFKMNGGLDGNMDKMLIQFIMVCHPSQVMLSDAINHSLDVESHLS